MTTVTYYLMTHLSAVQALNGVGLHQSASAPPVSWRVHSPQHSNCSQTTTWTKCWKISNLVPVYKKDGKCEAKGKQAKGVQLSGECRGLESTEHLERHHLLCTRQFGFREGRSASGMHLLPATELSAALYQGKAPAVKAPLTRCVMKPWSPSSAQTRGTPPTPQGLSKIKTPRGDCQWSGVRRVHQSRCASGKLPRPSALEHPH